MITPPDEVLRAIKGGALVAFNDSGGKDSQVSGIELAPFVPQRQRLFIHATLGESEWPGALEKARENAEHAGAPFLVVQAKKTFLEMVEQRFQVRPGAPSFPSPKFRTCSSDLKTRPLNSAIKRYAKEYGFGRVISVMGLRAEESRNRASKPSCVEHREHTLKERVSKAGVVTPGRQWLEYLPIHDFTEAQVFASIRAAGRTPHHAYELGNERVSCVLCIMGCFSDLLNGAKHNPELYQKYARMEVKTGYAMHPSCKTLPQITGIPVLPD